MHRLVELAGHLGYAHGCTEAVKILIMVSMT